MAAKNLWGELPNFDDIRTPHAILLEQASILEEMTDGLLSARVKRTTEDGKMSSTLQIIAPSLDNYTYTVTSVTHGVELYPARMLDLVNRTWLECDNERNFSNSLEGILSSDQVRKVIIGLLAQIRADNP